MQYPKTYTLMSGEDVMSAADCVKEIDRLRAELTEARRLIDEAGRQVPVAWQHGNRVDVIHDDVKKLLTNVANAGNGDDFYRPVDKGERYTIPLYAAPVPPQPAVSVAGVIAAYECGMQSTDHLNQYAHGTAEHDAFVHGVNHRYALAHMAAQTQHFAVPEAVAKDAIRAQRIADDICVICGGPHHTMQDAILSAADDEVKK